MTEEEGKDLLVTRRFWGLVLLVFGPLLSHYFNLSPAGYEGAAELLSGIAGGIVSLIGYLKRQQPISTVGGLPIKDTPKIALAMIALGLLLVVLGLVGCGSLPAPQNNEQRLYYAYASLTSARDTVTLLTNRGKLSAEEASAYRDKAADVRCGLDTARVALGDAITPLCQAGQLSPYLKHLLAPPKDAVGWLDLTDKILAKLEADLNAKQAGAR